MGEDEWNLSRQIFKQPVQNSNLSQEEEHSEHSSLPPLAQLRRSLSVDGTESHAVGRAGPGGSEKFAFEGTGLRTSNLALALCSMLLRSASARLPGSETSTWEMSGTLEKKVRLSLYEPHNRLSTPPDNRLSVKLATWWGSRQRSRCANQGGGGGQEGLARLTSFGARSRNTQTRPNSGEICNTDFSKFI